MFNFFCDSGRTKIRTHHTQVGYPAQLGWEHSGSDIQAGCIENIYGIDVFFFSNIKPYCMVDGCGWFVPDVCVMIFELGSRCSRMDHAHEWTALMKIDDMI